MQVTQVVTTIYMNGQVHAGRWTLKYVYDLELASEWYLQILGFDLILLFDNKKFSMGWILFSISSFQYPIIMHI